MSATPNITREDAERARTNSIEEAAEHVAEARKAVQTITLEIVQDIYWRMDEVDDGEETLHKLRPAAVALHALESATSALVVDGIARQVLAGIEEGSA